MNNQWKYFISAALIVRPAISCRDLSLWTMSPLALFPDCLIASSLSDYSHWHVHPLLYILLVWPPLSLSLFYHTSVSIIYSLYSILLPLCQFSPCGSPLRHLHLDLLFSLPPTHSPVFLSTLLFLVTFIFPLNHLPPFIPHRLSHPVISLLFFSSPPLFSVSVEPLWLHRYSDCWLCGGGGMLFRHSIRRYCTTCTLPHTIKTTAPNIPL